MKAEKLLLIIALVFFNLGLMAQVEITYYDSLWKKTDNFMEKNR